MAGTDPNSYSYPAPCLLTSNLCLHHQPPTRNKAEGATDHQLTTMIRIALVRQISQYSQRHIGEQKQFLPGIQVWNDCHRRRRYITWTAPGYSNSRSYGGGNANESDAGSSSSVSLCQINNHPDFRLLRKKEEMSVCAATKNSLTQKQATQWRMPENPIRSNDGTSSGALAADRLRLARRNAIETMIESFPARRSQKTGKWANNNSQTNQQHHTDFSMLPVIENPIRSNDGTSSGALVADRLRMARRKAIATTMNTPQQNEELASSVFTNTFSSASKAVTMIENPDRPNDGTSSGALAADRLRMARRKVIETMNAQRQSK